MILIGGGFSEESLKRIVKQIRRPSYRIDADRYCRHVLEIMQKLGRHEREEEGNAKNKVLTPVQEIEIEALRQQIKAILNRPPVIDNPY